MKNCAKKSIKFVARIMEIACWISAPQRFHLITNDNNNNDNKIMIIAVITIMTITIRF